MRVPGVRFGRDKRPIEPWEAWLLPLVAPLLLIAVMLKAVLGIGFLLGWMILSPVLPRSWRLWEQSFELDPTINAECPACETRLALGNRYNRSMRTDGDREITMTVQDANCPQCGRMYYRFSLGKIWSSWQEKATEQSAAAERPRE